MDHYLDIRLQPEEPEVSESVSRLTPNLGSEVLTVSTSEKTSARIKILDYLEIRGALK